MELSICRKDAVEWLTDEQWIVFSFYSGFARHLEQCYFTPGTPKNAEFEILVARIEVSGVLGYAILYRIRDTVENREALRAAITEFHEKGLLSLAQIDSIIEELRKDVRENVVPRLR